ncbi:PGF-pre-PGF domain-containing protein, partial [Halobium salinum]
DGNDGNTGAPSNGGGGGGGGQGGNGAPSVHVDVKGESDGSVTAQVRNGRQGVTPWVNIPDKQAKRVSGVTFERLEVTLGSSDQHFNLNVNTGAERPSSVSHDPADTHVKGYLEVNKDGITNKNIREATIRFGLSPDQLSEHSSPENVVLYRYHNGEWQSLDTKLVEEEDGEYVFAAKSPGFSVFAIGEKQPDMSISNVQLSGDSVSAGDSVDVTATVSNDGSGQGTYTATLTVDGNTVETKDVTVGAGESKEVSFSYTPTDAGEHEVSIGDESAGTLSVTEDGTTDESADEDDTTPVDSDDDSDNNDDDGTPVLAITMGLLVLLCAIGGALYYFREEVQQQLQA